MNLFKNSIVAMMVISSVARAEVKEPGDYIPEFRSDMEVSMATGTYKNVESMEIVKFHLHQIEQSDAFKVRLASVNGKFRELTMQIEEVKVDRCGSTTYTAILNEKPEAADYPTISLNVVDHSMRRCMDRRANRLEARLVLSGGWMPFHVHGEVRASGDKEAVYITQ